ncbi:TniB family NTP-binding protein [Marivirga sp. S37H4]|uniref:TniB family NTP-binding protein n=1 Tax=Marivirga aurantiaca TaxID=2802615 RepID=A0A934WZJ0_9BACT|nr:TniB family NTP-binding protein [Marivirga aurantiaca]MBK6265695.1 TniB family NTP-binding protein [Marivirga aurantiaca]
MMDQVENSSINITQKSNEERKQFIKGYKWIGYTRAQEVLDQFEDLVLTPRTTRMPDILLVGSSNNGKTVIIDRFAKNHLLYFDEKTEEVRQKVLMVESPPLPDEKRFYQQILRKLLVPFRSNHKPEVLFDQVVNAFQMLDIKILIIDEIHHLLTGNSTKKQIFLNAIKSLSNILSISIIAVGTKDAFHVFQSDPQMSSRFETVPLERWRLDKEYIKFLNSYEKILPLREKSDLFQREIATKIISLTNGNIGEICNVIQKSAIKAIDLGIEKITLQVIENSNIQHPDEKKKMPLL